MRVYTDALASRISRRLRQRGYARRDMWSVFGVVAAVHGIDLKIVLGVSGKRELEIATQCVREPHLARCPATRPGDLRARDQHDESPGS